MDDEPARLRIEHHGGVGPGRWKQSTDLESETRSAVRSGSTPRRSFLAPAPFHPPKMSRRSATGVIDSGRTDERRGTLSGGDEAVPVVLIGQGKRPHLLRDHERGGLWRIAAKDDHAMPTRVVCRGVLLEGRGDRGEPGALHALGDPGLAGRNRGRQVERPGVARTGPGSASSGVAMHSVTPARKARLGRSKGNSSPRGGSRVYASKPFRARGIAGRAARPATPTRGADRKPPCR